MEDFGRQVLTGNLQMINLFHEYGQTDGWLEVVYFKRDIQKGVQQGTGLDRNDINYFASMVFYGWRKKGNSVCIVS